MSTWNEITIERPGDIDSESAAVVEVASYFIAGLGTGLGEIIDRREARPYSTTPDPDGAIEINGESKYQAECEQELIAISVGRRVTWEETWDDEDGGSRTTIFEDGVVLERRGRSMVSLPDDWTRLLVDVRAELADSAYDASPSLIPAVRALLDAIDPEVRP